MKRLLIKLGTWLIFAGGLVLTSMLTHSGIALANHGLGYAVCDANGPDTGNRGSIARLVVVTQYPGGTPANVGVTIREVNGYPSIKHMPQATGPDAQTATQGGFGTGQSWEDGPGNNCQQDGRLTFGYGTTSNAGNGWVLFCHDGSFNTGNVSVFHIDPGNAGSGNGHWEGDTGDFTVLNGATTIRVLTWIENPPADQAPGGDVWDHDCTHVNGWAFDGDRRDLAISVHIYIDGPAGSGATGVPITANAYAPSVNQAFINAGYGPVGDNHGFDWTIPDNLKNGATHTLYLYAIGVDGNGNTNGNNPQISNSPTSFGPCSPPTRIQGRKVRGSGSFVDPGSSPPGNAEVDYACCPLGGKPPTTANGYSFDNLYAGAHRVAINPNTLGGWILTGYTLCYDRIDCHNNPPSPPDPNPDAGAYNGFPSKVVDTTGHSYADLYWHFALPASPPPPTVTTACSGTATNFTVNWNASNTPKGTAAYFVDVSPNNSFAANNYWNKKIASGTSTTGPVGFNSWPSGSPAMPAMTAGTNYYTRVYYDFGNSTGVASQLAGPFTARNDCSPPPPPAPTVSTSCPSGTSIANISWNSANNPAGTTGYFVDIDTVPSSAFSNATGYWHRGTGMTASIPDAPSGFSTVGTSRGTLSFVSGNQYIARVFYQGAASNTLSQTSTFTAAACAASTNYDNQIEVLPDVLTVQNNGVINVAANVKNTGTANSPAPQVLSDSGYSATTGGTPSPYVVPLNLAPECGSGNSAVYTAASPKTCTWTSPSPLVPGGTFSNTMAWKVTGNPVAGTKICFGGWVKPGKGVSGGAIVDAQHDAVRDPCVTVTTATNPYLDTTAGDLHAGNLPGNLSCSFGNGTGTIQGAAGTRVQYVVSAGASIKQIAPGISFGTGTPNGLYGNVCRPNLVKFADDFLAAHSSSGTSYTGQSQISSIPTGNTALLYSTGDVTLTTPMTVNGKVTLYVKGNVHITGSGGINYAPGAWTRDNLPAFGVIATGNILIDSTVNHLDGYYFAGGTSASGIPGANLGVIDTCADVVDITANVGPCANSPLVVNGLMMANQFRLKRTNNIGGAASEQFNFIGDLYLSTPPIFSDIISLHVTEPRPLWELPPLY